MTMYLPNPDVRPTGYEAGEFIDPAVVVPEIVRPETVAPAVGPATDPDRDPDTESPEAGDDRDETGVR